MTTTTTVTPAIRWLDTNTLGKLAVKILMPRTTILEKVGSCLFSLNVIIYIYIYIYISPAGCEKGYHSSCLSAGILDAAKVDQNYIRKEPPNRSIARDSYKKACEEGNIAEACHRLSAFYIKGVQGVCEKNMQEAFKYSLKGEVGGMAWGRGGGGRF